MSAADWIQGTLGPWGHGICSVVPSGFPAYARILHPAGGDEPPGGKRRSWTDVARENGRVPHSTMQFHNVVRPRGSPSGESGEMPSTGVLPIAERQLLSDLLATETSTPEKCWFCIWDGWGGVNFQGVTARVELPARQYLLHQGPISAALSVPPLATDRASVVTFSPSGGAPASMAQRTKDRVLARLWHGGPALWWPQDRSWFVATEIDLSWTYVGASERVIQSLLAHPELEVWLAHPSDRFTVDSDELNAALDVSQ